MGNRLKLKNDYHSRGIHTSYTGNPDSGQDGAGNAKKAIVQRFLKGRAEDVPVKTVAALRGAGLV